MIKLNSRAIISIFAILFLGLFVGFDPLNSADHVEGQEMEQRKQEYVVVYEESEIRLEGIYNKDGILLLPLQKLCSFLSVEFLECGRCGKDEIYRKEYDDPKGYLFINWYQNIISYSNDPTIIVLDAINEKIDGVTYTSAMLYQYVGFQLEIKEKEGKLIFKGALENAASMEGKSSVSDNNREDTSEAIYNQIVYAYDPACSSCEEITTLLDRLTTDKNTELVTLDASQEEKTLLIEDYEKQCKVPKDLKGIYPKVFIGEQYLYYSEITEDNINAALKGQAIEHNIILGESTSEVGKSADQVGGIEENDEGDMVLIYFYSTTCASCKSAVDTIYLLGNKYPELKLVGYNLYIPENITLLRAYGKEYGLKQKELGEIPAVFFSDRALVGEEIAEELEEAILQYDKKEPTTLLSIDDVMREKNILNGLSVLGAGLLNGLNPCSLSMFLFLLSLVMVDLKKVLTIGISFCLGKFVSFFLLGTLFYQFVSRMNIVMVQVITKNLLLLLILGFAILNLYDFIMAKRENYNKMLLQLPSWLKGVNQGLMKRSVKYTKSRYVILIMLAIGMLLGFGEFLCTGQIYLASIVVLIQGASMEGIAVIYLLLYSIAFVLPLFIVTMLVYYGKKVFRVSEGLLERLPMIKLINSVLFIAFGLYVVFR